VAREHVLLWEWNSKKDLDVLEEEGNKVTWPQKIFNFPEN